jgi:hypothetical protein
MGEARCGRDMNRACISRGSGSTRRRGARTTKAATNSAPTSACRELSAMRYRRSPPAMKKRGEAQSNAILCK